MKPAVKFGLISGSVAVLFNLLMYITSLNRSSSAQAIQWVMLVVPIACMYLSIKTQRDELGAGWITFGKAFNVAFVVGAIGGAIGSVFHFVYLKFIDPSFIEFQMQQQLDKMTERGMSEETIEMALKQTAPFMTPPVQFAFAILISLFFAAVLALIMAALFKKPNPEEIV